jgi:hypothetical protein
MTWLSPSQSSHAEPGWIFAGRVAPLLLLLALYWPGLTTWFYQDDFGWLNLRHEVHTFRDLGPALFAPKAHGNLRPLGENAYFLVFSLLAGIHPLPFRICAFVTQAASLVLLGSIIRRLTGSRVAALSGQLLWIVNPGLAPAMGWTSIYNQVLSGFFFLLAFYFLLLRIETGARRYYLAEWVAFLLGLGALETNVLYPAIAALYMLLFARKFLRTVVPMAVVSGLAVLAHFRIAPPPGGVYALHLDHRIFATVWTYWAWALGPAATWLSCAALALVAWEARRHGWLGVFAVAWFVIVVCPYLPLRDHKESYYLAVPVIGVAMLGAWAVALAQRARLAGKLAAFACMAVYLATSLPAAWAITRWQHARGERVEDLVQGVAEIHRAQPNKYILLDGVDSDLFWSGIADAPFRAMEIPHVYLVPGSESRIEAAASLTAKYALPQAVALRALQENRAVVYRVDTGALRNETRHYLAAAEALWKPETPRCVNLADPAFAEYYRATDHATTVELGGPRTPGERLHVSVFRTGNVSLQITVNSLPAAARLIGQGDGVSEFAADLPAGITGTSQIEVSLASAKPVQFGFVEVR